MKNQDIKDAIEVKIREQIEAESKPFQFWPDRRESTDGIERTRSNDENATSGEFMLGFVQDIGQLSTTERLTDALCNLMHWCDRERVDFERCLEKARTHHQAER